MAKIKFGMMMTDARGKLGGQVFSKNRSGAYVRTKVTPVNPQTTFQQANRASLGALSSNWSALTEAQRSAWNEAAPQWEKTNVFGDLTRPTGKNLFTGLNKVSTINFPGSAVQLVPPSKAELLPVVVASAIYAVGSETLTITFTASSEAGGTFQVRATPPVSQGTSFVKNLYRFIGVATRSGSTATMTSGELVARIGTVTAGDKIFIEIREVLTSGQLGVANAVQINIVA